MANKKAARQSSKKEDIPVLAITHKGCEEFCREELTYIAGKFSSELKDSVVIFHLKKYSDLIKMAYMSQSISRIMILLHTTQINSLEDCKKAASKLDLSLWLPKGVNFKVETIRKGTHNFSSQDADILIGEQIINSISEKGIIPEVKMNNPDVIILAYICDNQLYLGVDLSGFDLSKREYKIFANKDSIKGTVAFCMLKFSGYDKKKGLIDAFTTDGVIPIEAALYSTGMSHNFYRKNKFIFRNLGKTDVKELKKLDFDEILSEIDKEADFKTKEIKGIDNFMGNVISAKKNAKIAGIAKNIDFTRITVDWLDVKLKERQIDLVVSKPTQSIKAIGTEDLKKIYKEFFYQAEYVLKKTGKVCLIITPAVKELINEAAERYKFKLNKEHRIYTGELEMIMVEYVL